MRAPKNKEPVRVRLLGTGGITMAKGALRGVGGGSYKRSCVDSVYMCTPTVFHHNAGLAAARAYSI